MILFYPSLQHTYLSSMVVLGKRVYQSGCVCKKSLSIILNYNYTPTFHPWSSFVITKEYGNHLRCFHQKHRGIEEIWHEGSSPIGIHLTHKIVFITKRRCVYFFCFRFTKKFGHFFEKFWSHRIGGPLYRYKDKRRGLQKGDYRKMRVNV